MHTALRYASPTAFPISVNGSSILLVAQAKTHGVILMPLSLKPHVPYVRSPVGFRCVSPLPHSPSYHSFCQDYCSSPKVSLPPYSLLPGSSWSDLLKIKITSHYLKATWWFLIASGINFKLYHDVQGLSQLRPDTSLISLPDQLDLLFFIALIITWWYIIYLWFTFSLSPTRMSTKREGALHVRVFAASPALRIASGQ